MKVHVSGVGLLGAFVLDELARRGLPFTWDDADTPTSAWPVCTGAIIPYEDSEPSWYAQGYRAWAQQLAAQPEAFAPLLEPVQVVYALKGVPGRLEGSKPIPLGQTADGVRLWREPKTAWQLNAPQFVQVTRARFAAQRQLCTTAPLAPDVTPVRCWGIHDPAAQPIPLWGWARLVHLRPHARCPFWPTPEQPRVSLHFNDPDYKGNPGARYYFQPLAGTDLWWAGSDRVRQRTAVAPDTEKYVARFTTAVERVWGRWLTVEPADAHIRHGWRPEERNNFWKKGPPVRWVEGTLVPRPHARNGSQCGLLLARTLVDVLMNPRRPV
jgi:hypothetical protein